MLSGHARPHTHAHVDPHPGIDTAGECGVVTAVVVAVIAGAAVVTGTVTGVVRLWLRLRYKHKKKPNPYWIRLEEAATYSPT